MTKIPFDTLAYAKLLADGGVANGDVHSASLAKAMTQNVYTRYEMDNMIEAALKRFDERTQRIREESRDFREQAFAQMSKSENRFDKSIADVKLEMKEIENRIVLRVTKYIGVIVTALIVAQTVLHYFHLN